MSTLDTTTIAPAGTTWVADPVHSNVAFEVEYAGVSIFRGSFRDFDATLEGSALAGSGELTIKGVTKPVELHGRLAAAPSVDPFGRERLGLSLETAIDRNEFGVAWNAPNQSGGNYLGDEVTLKADLTFVKQEN